MLSPLHEPEDEGREQDTLDAQSKAPLTSSNPLFPHHNAFDEVGLKQGSVKMSAVDLHMLQDGRREASSIATYETAPTHPASSHPPSTCLAYGQVEEDTQIVRRPDGKNFSEATSSQTNSLAGESPTIETHTLSLNHTAAPFIPKQSSQKQQSVRPTLENALSEKNSADITLFGQDLLDRLIRVELSLFPLRDLAAQFATLRADVDFLLRAQRQQGNQPTSPSPSIIGNPLAATAPPASAIGNTDSFKDLSAQLADLSQTVSTLVSMQRTAQQPQAIPSAGRVGPAPNVNGAASSYASFSPQIGSPYFEAAPVQPAPNQRRVSYPDGYNNALSSSLRTSSSDSTTVNVQREWAALSACVSANILRAVCAMPDIAVPTKIQLKAIPCLLQAQEDVVAQCSTAMDAALTYAIPAIQLCSSEMAMNSNQMHVLICVATIERASFVHRICSVLGQSSGIRTSTAISRNIGEDKASIQRNRPHIVVGLAQPLLDLMAMRAFQIENSLRLFVVDEADAVLTHGLGDVLQSLCRLLPFPASLPPRQTAILGSTISQELLDYVSQLALKEPVRVLVRKSATNSSMTTGDDTHAARMDSGMRSLRHFYLYVAIASRNKQADQSWKLEAMVDLIEDLDFRQALVYCSSVDAVEAVCFKLTARGIEALSLTPEMGPQARQSAMAKFRSAASATTNIGASLKKVLVIVDSLSRTMHDLHQVPLVVNFDLPLAVEQYVHHASSAVASGYSRQGSVVNVIVQEDIAHLRRIEAFYGIRIGELPPSHNSIS